MDEYVFPGTSPHMPCAKNPNSYHYYMWDIFFQHIDIKPENVHILDGDCSAEDLEQECDNFEKKIVEVSKGEGIDLFVGGIGPDGHVAFNEPGSSLRSRTRIKTLAYDTVLANQEHFIPVEWKDDVEDPISKALSDKNSAERVAGNNSNDGGRKIGTKGFFVKAEGVDQTLELVPQTALTVGVGTVMDAKEVMILVTGQPKALALSKCIEEGVSHQWTVSMVQLHSKAIIVCDEHATVEMRVKNVDYYKGLAMLHNKMLGEDNPDNAQPEGFNSTIFTLETCTNLNPDLDHKPNWKAPSPKGSTRSRSFLLGSPSSEHHQVFATSLKTNLSPP